MGQFHFDKILFNQGWKSNIHISCNELGIITSIDEGSNAQDAEKIAGLSLPGFQNAHSHAFQYAMAGLAEVHPPHSTRDDFWSWREAMYKLALSVSPDQMESIATMLYSEMARHGYTNVVEFHYVHHDKDGNQYGNLAEMGTRMIAAAKNTGINITLCPIFYQKGGFGKDPVEGQRRFISKTVDDYLNLYKASEDACKYYDGANIAIGIHSMRGVEPRDIIEVSKAGPQKVPFHIHISEQLKEVEDSIAYLDRRPVEWLIENVELSDRFHLVHATHLTEEETKGIAQTGANVVLCPTTEGNLGDGLFPLDYFHKCGGNWSIGTDSHVGINPLEELRLLDYGQRLVSHTRDTFAGTHGDSGRFAIEMPLIAGRKAMNNYQHEFFSVGEKLNVSNLDLKAPLLRNTIDKNILSTLVYSSDSSQQRNTIVNGKTVVKNGKHGRSEEISNRFSQTMLRLALR